MAAELETFGFDRDEIKGGMYEKYKAKKSQTDRGSIVYTDPKAMVVGAKTHYKDKYFLCKKGLCYDTLGPSKWRVGSVLILYGTDRQGNPKTPFTYELLPWIFGEFTYSKLKSINAEYPLASHDIKISCNNEDYQNLDIFNCKECIWRSKEDFKTRILEEAKPIWEYLKKSIAADLSIEEIKDHLGSGTAAAGTDPSVKLNLDEVLGQI
jgi:hypothetical protein